MNSYLHNWLMQLAAGIMQWIISYHSDPIIAKKYVVGARRPAYNCAGAWMVATSRAASYQRQSTIRLVSIASVNGRRTCLAPNNLVILSSNNLVIEDVPGFICIFQYMFAAYVVCMFFTTIYHLTSFVDHHPYQNDIVLKGTSAMTTMYFPCINIGNIYM